MLKGIPTNISPDLLKILMEMGHGDEIVLADANFPAASNAQRIIYYPAGISELLKSILKLFPLDSFVKNSVSLMDIIPGDNYKPIIWDEYVDVLEKSKCDFKEFEYVERFKFYERTRKAYVVVATSETQRYANIILKKGIIEPT